MGVLSAWSTGANAQSAASGKHKHGRSQKAHHKATSGPRTRGSVASAGTLYGRKNRIAVTVTFDRTSRELSHSSEKVGNASDMTGGYMTGIFRKQKGRLPWPVDSKNIATSFGYHRYEPNPSVYRNDLGINISIDKDSSVRVVADGVVDDIMDIGDAKAIIVAHGKYFTIYSDLSMSIVVKGQVVSVGDVLGQVGETGQVDFRIFDPNDVWLDPQKWLTREKSANDK
jgi:murein DD-endopeptidase MepM/ murein hydrolase activator NlpD